MTRAVVVGGAIAIASAVSIADEVRVKNPKAGLLPKVSKEMHLIPSKVDPTAKPAKAMIDSQSQAWGWWCKFPTDCTDQGLVIDPDNCAACVAANGSCYITDAGSGSGSGSGSAQASLWWGTSVVAGPTGYRLGGSRYYWGTYDAGRATAPISSGGLGCVKIEKKKLSTTKHLTPPPIRTK